MKKPDESSGEGWCRKASRPVCGKDGLAKALEGYGLVLEHFKVGPMYPRPYIR